MQKELKLPDVRLLKLRRFQDDRGYFAEVFNARLLEESGINATFVQDNESLSIHKNTVRGLHYQAPPFEQGKLIRVLQGAIFDVAVDIRVRSPYFGEHVAVELSADEETLLWIPPGFLHGFMTLMPNTRVHYKVTNYYSKEHDGGVFWRDKSLSIDWPLLEGNVAISAKDEALPTWKELVSPFVYKEAALV